MERYRVFLIVLVVSLYTPFLYAKERGPTIKVRTSTPTKGTVSVEYAEEHSPTIKVLIPEDQTTKGPSRAGYGEKARKKRFERRMELQGLINKGILELQRMANQGASPDQTSEKYKQILKSLSNLDNTKMPPSYIDLLLKLTREANVMFQPPKTINKDDFSAGIINTGAGGLNPITGEFIAPTGDGGGVGTQTGTYFAPAAGGVINAKTGQFIPVHK